MTPVKDHEVCAVICKQVEGKKCAPPLYKVSIGLFVSEQDYKKSAKGGIVRGRECLAIAAILKLLYQQRSSTAALEHLSVLFICPPKGIVLSSPNIQSSKSVVLGLAPGNEARRQVAAVSKQEHGDS